MTNVPVLFLIFNRPDITQKVFASIKEAKPKKLFIAADGPRKEYPAEIQKCQATRKVVEQVDWKCDVKTLFREQNLGCKKAVSSAIDWFFYHVDDGIILEDDCLPNQSFFSFCENLLRHYRNESKIMHISGNNFQFGRKRGDGSYYFSIYNHIWGWATWRRAWEYYDITMSGLDSFIQTDQIEKITRDKNEQQFWIRNFEKVKGGEIDTWDFQWTFSIWSQLGLSVLPNANLIANIGFSADGTHIRSPKNKLFNMKTEILNTILHPSRIVRDEAADRFTFEYDFCGKMQDRKHFIAEAMNHFHSENCHEALAVIEQALFLFPEAIDLLYYKALFLNTIHEPDKAIESLKSLLSVIPEHNEAQLLLNHIQSTQNVKSVISLKGEPVSNQIESQNKLGITDTITQAYSALQANDTNLARTLLENTLLLHQSHRGFQYLYATYFLKTKQLDSACKALIKELQHFPDNFEAGQLLTLIQPPEATAMFSKGTEAKQHILQIQAKNAIPSQKKEPLKTEENRLHMSQQILSLIHINTHDIAGGAAKVAWRLAEAQRKRGHNSRMLVGNKLSNSEFSLAFPTEPDPLLHARCLREGQLFYEFQGSHKLVKHPAILTADIVHMHNLHGWFFNPFSVSALSHLKPTIWTLHDMQSFTGHCAHSFDCEKWKIGCGNCPYLRTEPALSIESTAQLWKDKKLIYDHSYLWIVSPSQWLKNKVEQSVLRNHPTTLIYNGIDTGIFKPYDKIDARAYFKIPYDAFIMGAVGHGGTLLNQWKGGQYTQSVLEILWSKIPRSIFVNIGANNKTAHPRVIDIEHLSNEADIARAYSALDIFLYTPAADNCPLVILEALACGIPVVTFNTGGIPELVRDGADGFVSEYQNVSQLAQFAERLYKNPDLRLQYSKNARERAVTTFEHQIIAAQYQKLYENCITEYKKRKTAIKLFPLSSLPKVIRSNAFTIAELSKNEILSEKMNSPDITQGKADPDVSIIVATKNRAKLLDEMLGSLKKAAEGVRYEVIVIEGNSTDNTGEILEKHGITEIYDEKEHLGKGKHSWPRLYNFGFSKARGKWAMFASDDIVFRDGCFANAIALLNKQQSEVAGGIFFYKNTATDVAGNSAWNDFGIDYTYGQKLLLNYGLVRLDAFREVNGLDEQYQFYCADGDLCLKLYEKGREFIPLPGCFVIHNNIADTQKQKNMRVAQRDIDRYGARWKHFVPTSLPNPRRLMAEDFPGKNPETETKQPEPEKQQTTPEKPRVMDQISSSGLWKDGQPLRLHLGCGEQHLDGYINIDYPPAEHGVMKIKADIHADIIKLEFPPGSVDEIRLHHVFEHFNRVTALVQLIKWHQWLKTGGTLRIETPDLTGSAKTLLSDAPWRVKTGVVRHLTGDQADAWAYHIDQWFPERFEHTLRKLGFDPVETKTVSWPKEPYLSNVHAIARKAGERSSEELLGAAEEILWESTVADSEKPTYEVWKRQLRDMLLKGSEHPHGKTVSAGSRDLTRAAAALQGPAAPLPLNEVHNFNQLSRDRWVREKAKSVPAGSRVLDIGAGTCPYRRLFSHCEYRTHDFKKYHGEKLGGTKDYGVIDYESDITDIPVPDSSFDVILCTEVLEHVPEPFEAVREMVRILKPGGRLFLTAPLGAGLHQMPFHFYGGFTPEWYKLAAERFNLQVVEIMPNGGFFRLLAQECARVAWTFDKHRHLHGKHADDVLRLFNELLPRYLFGLDEQCFIDQFTVGYNVEMIKPAAAVSEEEQLLEKLKKNFRDVPALIRLAEIEMGRSQVKKAKKYLIAATALEPDNPTIQSLREKLKG